MEYVRLSHSEEIFGQKNLLSAQIDCLNLVKKFGEYNKIRQQETAAKIFLKRKVAEAMDELKILEKLMPKVKDESNESNEIDKPAQKKRQSLELEIEEIRRKIERLQ